MEWLSVFKAHNTNVHSRPVHSIRYDFVIDTDQALVIESGEYRSITFPISYNESEEKLTNLFLHPYGDKYLAYLLTYRLTADDAVKIRSGASLSHSLLPGLIVEPLKNFDLELGVEFGSITTFDYTPQPWLGDDGKCYRHHNYGTASSPEWGSIECPDCECPSPSSGGGSGSGGGVSLAQYFAIIDLISQSPSGSSSSSTSHSPFNPRPRNPGSPVAGYPNPIFGVVLPEFTALNRFVGTLTAAQKSYWNDEDSSTCVTVMQDYLIEKQYSTASKSLVKEVLAAIVEYRSLYPEDKQLLLEFINNILYPPDSFEDINLPVPPSCHSFNFQSTGSNWQEAAVINIHFQISIISPQDSYVQAFISLPQAVLFGCPKILAVGNTEITQGIAATVSAHSLSRSMKETVHKYANKPVSNMMIELFFKERIKKNYPNHMPGGSAITNAQNYSVIPTQYQTTALGLDNCE